MHQKKRKESSRH